MIPKLILAVHQPEVRILQGDELKSGISICIFPEGTRNRTDDVLLEFHDGSFKIAEKTGCPVVPMSINNAAAIWEDHLPWIRKAHVVIEYGKPIYVRDLDREQKRHLSAAVQDVIRTNYEKNKALV